MGFGKVGFSLDEQNRGVFMAIQGNAGLAAGISCISLRTGKCISIKISKTP